MATPPAEEDLVELWGRKMAGDVRARDILVEKYVWLAKRLAYAQSIPDHVERDELISWALKGLMESVDRFDIEKSDGSFHKHFTAVASQRIRGAILDGLKSPATSWAPRAAWRRNKEQRQAEDLLQQKLGRSPSHAELAAELGVEVTELIYLRQQIPVGSTSEGEEFGLEAMAGAELTDQEGELLAVAERLASCIVRLGYHEQVVLGEVFYRAGDGLTPAKRLGVTVARMKEMRDDALMALRVELQTA